ncbi:segregation/condensation protein A [Streptomyces sp. S465]|nr:segregation/condensation protein A [Streptomyces sp. S465]
MPTNDAPAPPPRPPRRTLGRGPGARPHTTGPDRSTTSAQHPAAPPPASDAPSPRTDPAEAARATPGSEPATRTTTAADPHPATAEAAAPPLVADGPRDGARAAHGAPYGAAAGPEASPAVTEPAAPAPAAGATEAETRAGRRTHAQPRTTRQERTVAPGERAVPGGTPAGRGATAGGHGEGAAAGEPEPVHARADVDVTPSAGGHGGEATGAGTDGADGSEGTQGTQGGDQDDVEGDDDGNRFTVRLDNFEGPFDLLLQLISKHKLDVTEVALSKVTDEFMAHIRAMGPDWDLDQTTEFLVVAATLLDLKAARLLPAAEVEDEADLALLEARDLLFARLLQYRAYKRIADIFSDRLAAEATRHPRTVGLEPHHAELLPDVVISIGPEGFAKLAVKAMQPKPKPQVYVDHIHTPLVSVREQAEVVVARLRELGEATFGTLTEDAPDVLTVVARFLALLELYRERAVLLDQPEALGSLMVRWTGEEGRQPLVTDEFDQEAQARGKARPREAEPGKEAATPGKETATPPNEKEEVPS